MENGLVSTSSDWNTLVTVGATASLSLVFRALLNPGDGVLADACAYRIFCREKENIFNLS